MIIESKLYQYIQKNKNNNILKLFKNQLGLHVLDDPNEDLILIKYKKNNYYNIKDNVIRDIVSECRSVILDRNFNIVCWSPNKSVSINYFNTIINNWNDEVKVEPFIDGTMINCFYHNEQWYTSTRGSLKGNKTFYSEKSFNVMFNQALLYNKLSFNNLDKNLCYSFVLNHPDNRIVIPYDLPTIHLVYVYKIIEDGKFIEEKLLSDFTHLPVINEINCFNSYNDLKTTLDNLLFTKREDIIQGYVLKYKNIRSKIRHKTYNEIKKIRGNNPNLISSFIDIENNNNIDMFLWFYPEYKTEYEKYQNTSNFILTNIYKFYHKFFIKKSIDKSKIPKIFIKHCYELHNQLKHGIIPNNYVSRKIVSQYWKYLDNSTKYYTMTEIKK